MNVSRACVVRGCGCIVSGVRRVRRRGLFGCLCRCVRLALWGVVGRFPGLLFVGVCVYMGLPFPGLVAAFSGFVGTPPEGD